MKSLIFIGVLIFSSSSVFSQTIEIPPVAHPFFDVIEWKGMGALLLSKDPNGTSKQVNITLIGEEVTSIWDQKFSPKDEVYFYINLLTDRAQQFSLNTSPQSYHINILLHLSHA